MCGIVGVVHSHPDHAVPVGLIRGMCDTLEHRGPDDEGLFLDGRVGLGMRRLSIIDLEGGSQPIFNEDRSKVVVLNGEIYNYRELRRRLQGRGHVFRSSSDTETIVHLYEELGARCVDELRGMFAFAIWDDAKATLLIARDRFGIKPLYYLTAPWGIAFASELKTLHAAGLTGRDLDWNALDAFFQLGYIPAPASPFRDVRKLEPGHVLQWRGGGEVTGRRYWDLPTAAARREDDPESRVLEWLDEAVEAHLVSDVPVAALLSGGLDSSAVVSSMARHGGAPHAYVARYLGTGGPPLDESILARELAQRCGARLTIVDVKPELRDIIEPIVFALDEPHADESAVPSWLIAEQIGKDYKVALAGIGGDELFAGYHRHLGLLLSGHYGRLPGPFRRGLCALANRVPEPDSTSLVVNRLKRFVDGGHGGPSARYLALMRRLPNGVGSRLYRGELERTLSAAWVPELFRRLYEAGGSPEGLRAGLYLDYKTYLPDDLLHVSDRIAMAHSLEVRVPFVDHQFVEKAFPLPDRLKIGRGRTKRLLRRALRDRLPRAHLRAPKRGFVGPTAMWLRHELREMVTDELSPDRISRLGFFEPAGVAALLEDHFSRRHNREGILWALLCFSTWHRLYVETGVTRPDSWRAPVAAVAASARTVGAEGSTCHEPTALG